MTQKCSTRVKILFLSHFIYYLSRLRNFGQFKIGAILKQAPEEAGLTQEGHGLPLTNAEKREVVDRLLRPERIKLNEPIG